MECGIYTGILFTRKLCGQPAAVYCGRCKIPLCKKHLVVQANGPFLCVQCDRYEHDNDWHYADDRWHYRSSRSDSEISYARSGGVAAGAGAAAAAADDGPPSGLSDADKDSFVGGQVDGMDPSASDDRSDDDSDFDAS